MSDSYEDIIKSCQKLDELNNIKYNDIPEITPSQAKQLYFKKQNEGLSDLELVQLEKFLEESKLLDKYTPPNMKLFFNIIKTLNIIEGIPFQNISNN